MFAGAIVDRLPLKRTLVGADLFIAAVSAIVAAVSRTGALPVWVVMVALFFRAIGNAFHTPAFQALTPLVAPPKHLTRLAGVTQAVQSGGYILGTAIAAVIYPLWGLTAMIALDVAGALFATVAIIAARLDVGGAGARDAAEAPVNAGGMLAQLRALVSETAEGYRVLRGYGGLFALTVVRLCLYACVLAHLGALSHHDARSLRRHHGRCRDGRDRVSVGMIAGIGGARLVGRIQEPVRSRWSRLRRSMVWRRLGLVFSAPVGSRFFLQRVFSWGSARRFTPVRRRRSCRRRSHPSFWAEYSVCMEPSCRGRCRWGSLAHRSSQMLWELLHGLLERVRRWLCLLRLHGRFPSIRHVEAPHGDLS